MRRRWGAARLRIGLGRRGERGNRSKHEGPCNRHATTPERHAGSPDDRRAVAISGMARPRGMMNIPAIQCNKASSVPRGADAEPTGRRAPAFGEGPLLSACYAIIIFMIVVQGMTLASVLRLVQMNGRNGGSYPGSCGGLPTAAA